MKVITAVEKYKPNYGDITVFLAGGITDCDNWQKRVIDYLKTQQHTEHLVVFNPRRDKFPINDPNAAEEQITWEFNNLEKADMFSMYFCDSKSDQPICLYELGRNLQLMQNKYDNWYNRIIISSEDAYKRKQDVIIQTKLATDNTVLVNSNATPEKHAKNIYVKYNLLINKK